MVGDYFSMAGVNYLVLGDRFSGWLSIYTAARVSLMPRLWSRDPENISLTSIFQN